MNNLKNFGSILYLARKFFLNVFYVGRKTYLNNTRTTVPRALKSKKVMKRSFKNGLGSIPKKKKKTGNHHSFLCNQRGLKRKHWWKKIRNITLQIKIKDQADNHIKKKHETQKKNELLMNKLIISAYKFILDKFKHNNANFKSLNRFWILWYI